MLIFKKISWSLFNTKKVIFSFLIILVFYTIFVFAYPFFWASYYSKTTPPNQIKNTLITNNSQNTQNQKTLKVAVIGDSTALGQGADSSLNSFSYQYLTNYLEGYLQIRYNNFAVSGARIDQVLQNQLSQVPMDTDLIFVSIGANDVVKPMSKKYFKQKINDLANKLKTYNCRVVWLSVPDFITSPIILPPLNIFLSSRTKNFNSAIKQATENQGFMYVDVYDSTREEFRKKPEIMFSRDKYHPSKKGYELWSKTINNSLKDGSLNDK